MTEVLRTEGLVFQNHIHYPDVEVARGAVTFLTGPSGCGKSTLLRLFNGVLSPSAGTVFYNGAALPFLDSVALRREVLLAGQAAYLFPGTVGENFRIYADYRDEPCAGEEAMCDALRLCCVPFSPADPCDKMSGGERQRVFLAICLSFAPKVLMLDEPTSALDARTADVLMGAVSDHCRERGITLLAVSHDSALAGRYADAQIALGEGTV